MATLHIVNKAAALDSCLSLVGERDAVLLIEDGVYAARHNLRVTASLHVLESDLQARGLAGRVDAEFQILSYDGFVRLVEQYSPIVTWSR